ncbi:MAG: hypothetical protein ABJP34_01180 [Erythrobacter sp.]
MLQEAADEGFEWAAVRLGWMFEYGHHVAKDADKAIHYYRIASTADEPDTFYRMGGLLQTMEKKADAADAFEKGAMRGHIGCMYWFGWGLFENADCDADRRKGRELIQNAAARGHVWAKHRLISIEWRETSSPFRKMRLAAEIAICAALAFKAAFRDPYPAELH